MQLEPVPPNATLGLQGLRLPARLGWEAGERGTPQLVEIGFTLRWRTLPPACARDDLAGTVDYAILVDRVREVCSHGEYRLLEGLAKTIYDALRPMIPGEAALAIVVAKRPRLTDLDVTASFTIDDGRAGAGPRG